MPKGRPKKVSYTATLILTGKQYVSEGNTFKEAVLGLNPGLSKGRGVLILEKGESKIEKILMPRVVFGLFNSHGLNKDVALKNIALLFGEIA